MEYVEFRNAYQKSIHGSRNIVRLKKLPSLRASKWRSHGSYSKLQWVGMMKEDFRQQPQGEEVEEVKKVEEVEEVEEECQNKDVKIKEFRDQCNTMAHLSMKSGNECIIFCSIHGLYAAFLAYIVPWLVESIGSIIR
jgi:hypothetical protein